MDKKIFEERVRRLQEVDKIIKSLDPAIREASFQILESYVTGKKTIEVGKEKEDSKVDSQIEKEEFFIKFIHDKPADNVLLITAFHYNEYGVAGVLLETTQWRNMLDWTIGEATASNLKEYGSTLAKSLSGY